MIPTTQHAQKDKKTTTTKKPVILIKKTKEQKMAEMAELEANLRIAFGETDKKMYPC
jgi:hypothetical protein